MNFDIKLKLVGYYSGDKQNMYPEKRFIEEAAKLNELLEKTFQQTFSGESGIVSEDVATFYESFLKDSVYILKDEDKNLYAWFKAKHIARISRVKYDRDCIIPIPIEFQSWFVLGEPIPKNETTNRFFDKNGSQEIVLYDTNDNKHVFQEKDLIITTAGSDLLILLNKKRYALSWSPKERITIKELKRLILHRWSYLQEIPTNSLCGSCDGWDYSHCDPDCDEDCEGCNVRRNKCRTCFCNRYDTCVQIQTYRNAGENEISEAQNYISAIMMPKSNHLQLMEMHKDFLETLYSECASYPLYHKTLSKYCEVYNKLQKKEKERALPEDKFVNVTIIRRSKKQNFLIPNNSFDIEEPGCLFFLGAKTLDIQGYNKQTDDYILPQRIYLDFAKGYKKDVFFAHIDNLDFSGLSLTIDEKSKVKYEFS